MALECRATLGGGWRESARKTVIVKVPRLNVSPLNQDPHDHLQHVSFNTFTPSQYLNGTSADLP
jgi:hypothetical protein